jgi:geranylgeranylglycerol-phosphate geranylgeranyltransferase
LDVEGDSARNSRTLARARGLVFASRTSVPFFIIAMCLSPLPFLLQSGRSFHLNLKYLIPVAVTDLLLVLVVLRALKLSSPGDAAPLRKLSLLALGIGLIGFLLGTF